MNSYAWFNNITWVTLITIIVTISEIFSRKKKISWEYLIGLFKSQFYYLMTYILTIVIVVVISQPTHTLVKTVVILIIIIQTYHFLTSFLIHLKTTHSFKFSNIDITVFEFIVDEANYLIYHYVNKISKQLRTRT